MTTKTNPFDIVNSINKGEHLSDEQVALSSVPWITNMHFSLFPDTIFHANVMNLNHEATPQMQYDYFINSVRAKRRFAKWPKRVDNDDVQAVMQYFGYSRAKAEQAMKVLSSQHITTIKSMLEEGGRV